MNSQTVEILFVEDNPADQELALRALRKHRITNSIQIVADGAEELDFVLGKEIWPERRDCFQTSPARP